MGCPQILRNQDKTDRRVREGKPGRGGAERFRHMDGKGGSRNYLGHGQKPVPHILAVEAGEVEGVPYPGPPDRHEEHKKTGHAGPGIVFAQARSKLRNRRHEDQVVKELQPGGVPLFFPLLPGAEPRRLEKFPLWYVHAPYPHSSSMAGKPPHFGLLTRHMGSHQLSACKDPRHRTRHRTIVLPLPDFCQLVNDPFFDLVKYGSRIVLVVIGILMLFQCCRTLPVFVEDKNRRIIIILT